MGSDKNLRTYFLFLLGLFVVPVASLLVRHLLFNEKVSFPLRIVGSNLWYELSEKTGRKKVAPPALSRKTFFAE